ncbi:MAG: Orotidine 5-phosphate decarboxylase subfamily 1 core [Gemmatimonadetes bacterium]|nr:Orotidine 5-phosphate decarboxylase subfamily 1 core [Gemmatimonadota bacterium]
MSRVPVPIVALDVPDTAAAMTLLDRIGPAAGFVKVGLQLFVSEGPAVVRAVRERGARVFLDLKLHDIPNTVARAVESAAKLDVELLTLHASGGARMLRAAREAAGARGGEGPRLLAVTVLTSLPATELRDAWGRGSVDVEAEAARLARMASDAGMDGVVAAVREAAAIRAAAGERLRILAPGIRRAGDAAGDQARVATPGQAAEAGVDYVVVGRTVTAADDPAAAMDEVLRDLRGQPADAA